MNRKEQSEQKSHFLPGTMRKPGFSHKRSDNKGTKKINVSFAKVEKIK